MISAPRVDDATGPTTRNDDGSVSQMVNDSAAAARLRLVPD